MRQISTVLIVVASLLVSASAWGQLNVGGGGGLVVDSTQIFGICSNGYVLYNNAGTLGCQAGSGSFTVTAGGNTSSGVTTLAFGNGFTVPTGSSGTATISQTVVQNSPSDGGSHSYTVQTTDGGLAVVLGGTFTAAVVPQATSGFADGYGTTVYATAATVATSTTSTINGIAGSTGINLGAHQETEWVSSGGNWLVALGVPQPATQSGSTYLRDDMTWQTPAGASGANPSATVSGSAVNGSATTFMRSDAAPALASTAVTPGSYTSANITVDQQGRLTAAANGSGGGGANPIFGNGADGNLSASFGTVTLTRDANYNNVTFGATDHIVTQGYRLFVAGTLDLSSAGASAIEYRTAATRTGSNGMASGSGGAAAAPLRTGLTPSCLNGGAGGAGGTTTGSVGIIAQTATASSSLLYGTVGFPAGAQGGAGSSAAGGAAASSALGTAPVISYAQPNLPLVGYTTGASVVVNAVSDAGSGGSGGGGDGTHTGGGGGGGGDCGGGIYVYASTIARGSNATASIVDGKGGTGGNGGGGGGSCSAACGGGGGANGGAGGFINIVVNTITGSAITNALDVSSGAGGSGGTHTGTGSDGTGGTSGYTGAISVINLGAPSLTTTAGGSSANVGTGTTGGASKTSQQNL